MEQNFDLQKIKKIMLRKYAPFGSIISNINYKIIDKKYTKTAGTDGKTIYFNGKFMSSIPENEQVFVFAHEVLHIVLKHIIRRKGKQKKLWNRATDAIINQQLKKDGLEIPEGCVNIPDALSYNAEELYEKLLKEKKQYQQQKRQQRSLNEQQNQQEQPGQDGQPQQNQQQQQSQDGQDQGQQGKSEQQNQLGQNGKNQEQQNQQPQQGQDGQDQEQQGQNEQQNQLDQNGKDQEQQNNNQSQNSQSQNEQDADDEDYDEDYDDDEDDDEDEGIFDDHSLWDDAEKEQNGEQSNDDEKIDEREVFKKLEEDRLKRAKDILQKINNNRWGLGGESQEVYLGDVGEADKSVTNWKRILAQTIEKEEEIWSSKFSDKYNNYAVRLEDVEIQDELSETEIILDVSGSVSIDLLKNFLRQVKKIIKDSKIKIGTFSDEFHGFVEIKKKSDIDSLELSVGGGTNFDAASRAFSNRKNVNKICFTDGDDDNGNAHIKEKRKDIIWICYVNKNFKPDYGKVIYVNESEINNFSNENDTGMSL